MKAPSLQKKLERLHRELSEITVSVNRALTVRAMRPGAEERWACELERIAKTLRAGR